MATIRVYEVEKVKVLITNMKNITVKQMKDNKASLGIVKIISTCNSLFSTLPFILEKEKVQVEIKGKGLIKSIKICINQSGIMSSELDITDFKADMENIKDAFDPLGEIIFSVDDKQNIYKMQAGDIVTDFSNALKEFYDVEGAYLIMADANNRGGMNSSASIVIVPQDKINSETTEYISNFAGEVSQDLNKINNWMQDAKIIKSINLKLA